MILVLGGGFLGKGIYSRLKGSGQKARLFSRTPDAQFPEMICGRLEEIDMQSGVLDQVDTVIHALHTIVPASAHENDHYEIESNVLPFVDFLSAARKKGIKRIIFISTGGAIYGNSKGLEHLNERSPLNPLSAYGASKLAIEKQLLLHKDHFRDGVTILRPSNIYGRGQRTDRPQGVVGHLIEAALTGKEFELWGEGNSKKDYLYLEDFLSAVETLLAKPRPEEEFIFNISSAQLYSVNEIRQKVEELSGKKINVKKIMEKDFDVRSFALDSSLFRKSYGWSPRYDLGSGLAELLAR